MKETQKIVKLNLSDQVSNSLKEMTLQGRWAVGDRLPSEQELAVMFGVSRLTVRLALQKLNAQGLLETRVGEGTFVKEFDFGQYLDEVSDMVMQPGMLDDVYEFRRCIELESLRLAIQNCSDEDFEVLEKLLLEMKAYIYDLKNPNTAILESYSKKDYEFHAAISRICGNSLFHLAFTAARKPITAYLYAIVDLRMKKIHEEYPELERVCIEETNTGNTHINIIERLKSRDFEGCKAIYLNLADYKIPVKGLGV